jgi:hypothetical protein
MFDEDDAHHHPAPTNLGNGYKGLIVTHYWITMTWADCTSLSWRGEPGMSDTTLSAIFSLVMSAIRQADLNSVLILMSQSFF